jgi:hypothetical protein
VVALCSFTITDVVVSVDALRLSVSVTETVITKESAARPAGRRLSSRYGTVLSCERVRYG